MTLAPLRVHVMRAARLWNVIGPVILSAFSLFVSFHILQPLALALDPTFTLLANRSVGKIAFTMLIITHICLLMSTLSYATCKQWVITNVSFLGSTKWIKPFALTFLAFFTLHWCILFSLVALGYASVHPETLTDLVPKAGSLLLGFIATFFLAWTEETIFRGTLYPILCQTFSPLASIFGTSLIFSLAHNITNPLMLISDDWKLGLGLFLLGFLLNLIFSISSKLYIGMGAHAGLVYVKVFLRRIPLISVSSSIPWYLHGDLRQSVAIHVLFACSIIGTMLIYRKNLRLIPKV